MMSTAVGKPKHMSNDVCCPDFFFKLRTAQGDLKIKEVFKFQVKQAHNKQTPPYEYLVIEMFDPGYSPFHQPVIHPMLPQYGNQSVLE